MPVDAMLLLLRHGQSEWNAVHRWQGTADSPLTDLGRRQAAEAACQLATLQAFDAVFASSLSRAAVTAAIIGDELSLGTLRADDRLREAYAGAWEGLTPALIEEGWPGWLDEHRRPADFESFDAVIDRVLTSLSEISRDVTDSAISRPARALVVTHSGVIRSLIRQLGGIDDRIPNLGGVWVEASFVGAQPRFSLGDLFDPTGIVLSGVDTPGEEPGD
jgi:broad specificity phosphatase PhoE